MRLIQLLLVVATVHCMQSTNNSATVTATSDDPLLTTNITASNPLTTTPSTPTSPVQTSTAVSPQLANEAAELIEAWCVPSFPQPLSADDAYGEALCAYFNRCALNVQSQVSGGVYTFSGLNLVMIPHYSVYQNRLAASTAFLIASNLTAPAAVVADQCRNWFLNQFYYAGTIFVGPTITVSPRPSPQMVLTFQIAYAPLSLCVLVVSVSILRKVRQTNKNYKAIVFAYAEAIAQFVSFLSYLTNQAPFFFIPFFLPFCYVSPLFALNTQSVAMTFIGDLIFPYAYVWCYQSILHVLVALDRVVCVFAPVWYRNHVDEKTLKRGLFAVTLGYVLLCFGFIVAMLVGTFGGLDLYAISWDNDIWIHESVFIFVVVMLAVPFLVYTALSFALMLHFFAGGKKELSSQQERKEKQARQVTNFVLSVYAVNLVTIFSQFLFLVISCCLLLYFCFDVVDASATLYDYSIYQTHVVSCLLDFNAIACFILQCACSSMYRAGVRAYFRESSWVGRCFFAVRDRVRAARGIAPDVGVGSVANATTMGAGGVAPSRRITVASIVSVLPAAMPEEDGD